MREFLAMRNFALAAKDTGISSIVDPPADLISALKLGFWKIFFSFAEAG